MVNPNMEMDAGVMDNLSEEQKIAFLMAFSKMAAVDGSFDDVEREFIYNVAANFGISRQHTSQIMEDLSEEHILAEVSKINNRRCALELIKEMCVLAHADDELSDAELLFIGKVAQAMGIELTKVEQISNWVIDRLIWLEEAKIIFEEV